MRDPLGLLDGDCDRVAAADEEVTGVQAEPDAGAGEHPVGLLPGLDHRPDVRVERRGEPAVDRRVGDPVEVGQEGGPPGLVELGALVVPLRAGGGGEDDGRGLRRDEPGHRRLDDGKGVDRRVVEDDRHELTDRGQAVLCEGVRLALRRVGEEAVGTELGGRDPELPHLPEHGGRLVLPAPAGHLAHPPRDGGGGDALGERRALGGLLGHGRSPSISERATGRRSARETSHASAVRKASRASAMVHGLAARPAATSRKAVSSAR